MRHQLFEKLNAIKHFSQNLSPQEKINKQDQEASALSSSLLNNLHSRLRLLNYPHRLHMAEIVNLIFFFIIIVNLNLRFLPYPHRLHHNRSL